MVSIFTSLIITENQKRQNLVGRFVDFRFQQVILIDTWIHHYGCEFKYVVGFWYPRNLAKNWFSGLNLLWCINMAKKKNLIDVENLKKIKYYNEKRSH